MPPPPHRFIFVRHRRSRLLELPAGNLVWAPGLPHAMDLGGDQLPSDLSLALHGSKYPLAVPVPFNLPFGFRGLSSSIGLSGGVHPARSIPGEDFGRGLERFN